MVAGDPGTESYERDDWKDLFGRLSYTLFQNSSHELVVGGFGYRGRSEAESEAGGVTLVRRDDFWLAGGDIELDAGPINLSGIAYYRRHEDALLQGGEVNYFAGRGQVVWGVTRGWTVSVAYEEVRSKELDALDTRKVSPHVTWALRQNVLLTAEWRQNLSDADRSSGVATLDVAF